MVDNLTFDDGEPITQNKLQSLYTAIKTLEGQAAKSTIQNQTDNTISTPVTFSGTTGGILLNKTHTPTTIKFNGFSFETDSVRVVVTPAVVNPRALNVGSIDYYVTEVSRSGFTIYTASIANAGKTIGFNYIANEMRISVR
jgi:hypothetical protein